MKFFGKLAASAVVLGTGMALLSAPKAAHAQWDVTLLNVTAAPGGLFDFNYQFSITTGSDIVAGDFVTIYDFAGFTGVVSDTSATITSSSQAVGITPPLQAPPDNPALQNITFTSSAAAGPGALFQASIRTSFGQIAGPFTPYSGQGRDTTGTSPTQRTGTAFTQGPNPSALAPEPGSVALLGVGFMGMAGVVIRRRKAA